MRLDTHCHLGHSYEGKVKRSQPWSTPEDVMAFFEKEQITHACVIYLPNEVYLLESLLKLAEEKKVKIYPFQWIDTYKEKIYEWDAGVKLHPVRGSKISPLSSVAGRFFRKLPSGFKVLIHTQGSSSLKNISRPQMVLSLSLRHPDKIFIVGHSGAYGFRSFRPSQTSNVELWERYYHSKLLVNEAEFVASVRDNVWLESSYVKKYLMFKIKSLCYSYRIHGRVLLGSDFPYLKEISSIVDQERCLMEDGGLTEEEIKQMHLNGIKLIEGGGVL
ncbi:MAG TPA: hypothetical protein P5140_05700 [Methanofastidiosum sp.]|nr:hypothetical protein [Methanofastidiosum sp.]